MKSLRGSSAALAHAANSFTLVWFGLIVMLDAPGRPWAQSVEHRVCARGHEDTPLGGGPVVERQRSFTWGRPLEPRRTVGPGTVPRDALFAKKLCIPTHSALTNFMDLYSASTSFANRPKKTRSCKGGSQGIDHGGSSQGMDPRTQHGQRADGCGSYLRSEHDVLILSAMHESSTRVVCHTCNSYC